MSRAAVERGICLLSQEPSSSLRGEKHWRRPIGVDIRADMVGLAPTTLCILRVETVLSVTDSMGPRTMIASW